MKKVSVLLLIIVSLIMASFAGIGVPRASAAGLTVTPSSTAAGGNSTSMTVSFASSSYTVSYMTMSLQGFTFSGTYGATITGGAWSSSATVTASGSGAAITFSPALAAGYTYTLYLNGYITNPSTAGTYAATATLVGSGTQTLTGTISIGTGSGGLAVSSSSTAAGGYSTYMTIGFTPSYSVSSMLMTLSGFTFSSISGASVSGGASSTVTATPSGSTVSLTFSPALTTGYAYTVYLGGYILNPSTAGTYNAAAYLSGSGSQTLAGTVTIGSGTGYGGLAVTPRSTTVGAYSTSMTIGFTPAYAVSTMVLTLNGFTVSGVYASISGSTATATPSGSTVYLTFSPALTAGASYYLYLSGYIVNPTTAGTYTVVASLSDATGTQTLTGTVAITGTSVTGLTVTAAPTAQSAIAQFTVTFTASSTGALAVNSGTILIDFPSTVTLPSSLSSGLITVNGSAVYYASITTNNAISITTPVAITAYQQVTVVLPVSLGIRNPSSAGVAITVAVSTSSDVTVVSTTYTTTTSQITQPQVQLTSYGAGSVAGYTISFNTGAAGSLRANYDTITINFPTSTVLPNTISHDLVKVNNYLAYSVTTSGNRLTIIAGVSAAANASIQIVIDKTAGIKNPSTAGSYTLQSYTSIETSSVNSAAYTIVNLPRTLMTISPASPDGLSGYYKTRPTVVLSASSPVSSVLTTYYSINGAAQQVYTTPFQLPDGTDTLTYYSRDQQGNQEDAQTFTAKVDATPPTATIISPAQGVVVGVSPVTIVGKVSPGMQVSVAGTSVTVSATGDFSANVSLKEGPQTVTISVTSVSGNVGQTQLALTLDTTPPILTITKPVMYSTVLTSICEVSGKTEPGAIVKIAGSAVTVNADGTFSSNVMLQEGDNLINITATDAVGNERKTAIPVTYKARTVIHLQVGNKTAMVNDTKKTLQVAPVIKSGNTMVPLRFIGEAFGATITWDPVFQIIDISLKGSSIRLQVGTNFASIAGKKVIFQGVPVIISGTTMVPIRFISEAFGAQVNWTAATQGIDITYPKP